MSDYYRRGSPESSRRRRRERHERDNDHSHGHEHSHNTAPPAAPQYIPAQSLPPTHQRDDADSSSLLSSSSTSESLLNISAPKSRAAGLFSFFTAPDPAARRRKYRKKKKRLLAFGNSSSSSLEEALAYGRGYVDKERRDAAAAGRPHAQPSQYNRNQESFPQSRRQHQQYGSPQDHQRSAPPHRDKTDEEIQQIGRQLAKMARDGNREEMFRNGSRRGISGLVAGAAAASAVAGYRHSKSSDRRDRGIGSSRPQRHSDSGDESDWETSSEDEYSSEDVDLVLAYGASTVDFPSSKPPPTNQRPEESRPMPANARKSHVVDPQMFGPMNSLRGLVNTPCGFEDPVQKQTRESEPRQNRPVPSVESASFEARPLREVYPVPTSDPNRFDITRAQSSTGSRPYPVPIQAPKPIVPISSRVYDAQDYVKSEPRPERELVKRHSDSSFANVALAGLAGVVGVGAAAKLASDYKDKRDDRRERDEPREIDAGLKRARSEKITRTDEEPRVLEGPDHRDNRHRHRHKDEPAVPVDDSRRRQAELEEKIRRLEASLRDQTPIKDTHPESPVRDRDQDRERKRRDKKRRSVVIEQGDEAHTSSKSRDKDKHEGNEPETSKRSSRGFASAVASSSKSPVEPLDSQAAYDDFPASINQTPKRPLTPLITTVEREPNFSKFDTPGRDKPQEPTADDFSERLSRLDSFEREVHDVDDPDSQNVREATEHSTDPLPAAAIAAAATVLARHGHRGKGMRKSEPQPKRSRSEERDAVQEEANRHYRQSVLARKIAEDQIRSRSASPENSPVDGHHEDPVIRIVTPPEMHRHEKGKFEAPNADVRIDNIIEPKDLEQYRLPRGAHLGDPSKFPVFKSRDPSAERERPMLNLVRPTPAVSPIPSPSLEEQQYRAPTKASENEATEEPKSASDVIMGPRGEIIELDPRKKSMPHEDDKPITEIPEIVEPSSSKKKKKKKGSGWGTVLAGIAGAGAATAIAATVDDTPKSIPASEEDRQDRAMPGAFDTSDVPADADGATSRRSRKGKGKQQVWDNEPPSPGPKPASPSTSQSQGAFADDLDFAATLAAGLQDSGFDPNIVIDDPLYRRRDSPPGTSEPVEESYHTSISEVVPDLDANFTNPYVLRSSSGPSTVIEIPRSDPVPDASETFKDAEEEIPRKLSKKERRRLKETQNKNPDETLASAPEVPTVEAEEKPLHPILAEGESTLVENMDKSAYADFNAGEAEEETASPSGKKKKKSKKATQAASAWDIVEESSKEPIDISRVVVTETPNDAVDETRLGLHDDSENKTDATTLAYGNEIPTIVAEDSSPLQEPVSQNLLKDGPPTSEYATPAQETEAQMLSYTSPPAVEDTWDAPSSKKKKKKGKKGVETEATGDAVVEPTQDTSNEIPRDIIDAAHASVDEGSAPQDPPVEPPLEDPLPVVEDETAAAAPTSKKKKKKSKKGVVTDPVDAGDVPQIDLAEDVPKETVQETSPENGQEAPKEALLETPMEGPGKALEMAPETEPKDAVEALNADATTVGDVAQKDVADAPKDISDERLPGFRDETTASGANEIAQEQISLPDTSTASVMDQDTQTGPSSKKKKKKGKKNGTPTEDTQPPTPLEVAISTEEAAAPVDEIAATSSDAKEPDPVVITETITEALPEEWTLPAVASKKKGKKGKKSASSLEAEPSPTSDSGIVAPEEEVQAPTEVIEPAAEGDVADGGITSTTSELNQIEPPPEDDKPTDTLVTAADAPVEDTKEASVPESGPTEAVDDDLATGSSKKKNKKKKKNKSMSSPGEDDMINAEPSQSDIVVQETLTPSEQDTLVAGSEPEMLKDNSKPEDDSNLQDSMIKTDIETPAVETGMNGVAAETSKKKNKKGKKSVQDNNTATTEPSTPIHAEQDKSQAEAFEDEWATPASTKESKKGKKNDSWAWEEETPGQESAPAFEIKTVDQPEASTEADSIAPPTKKKGKKNKKAAAGNDDPQGTTASDDKSLETQDNVESTQDGDDKPVAENDKQAVDVDGSAPKKSKKKSKKGTPSLESPKELAATSEASPSGVDTETHDAQILDDLADTDDNMEFFEANQEGEPPDKLEHNSNGDWNETDNTDDLKSAVSAPVRPDQKAEDKEDKRTSGGFFGFWNRASTTPDSKETQNGNTDEGKDKRHSFLANAGTIGAGVGLAGAVAAIANHASRSNATSNIKTDFSRSRSTSPPSLDQRSFDPEIIERVIKPAIDPQFGDLLPLPPSVPASPTTELPSEDDLPALPISRPETPPEQERQMLREKWASRRRSQLETPIKSPSATAVPIQFRLRSVPSSPGLFTKASPSQTLPTTALEPSSASRRVLRPMSWDTSREIKPLYLPEHVRSGSVVESDLQLPELPESRPSTSGDAAGPQDQSWAESAYAAYNPHGATLDSPLQLKTAIVQADHSASDPLESGDVTPKAEQGMKPSDGLVLSDTEASDVFEDAASQFNPSSVQSPVTETHGLGISVNDGIDRNPENPLISPRFPSKEGAHGISALFGAAGMGAITAALMTHVDSPEVDELSSGIEALQLRDDKTVGNMALTNELPSDVPADTTKMDLSGETADAVSLPEQSWEAPVKKGKKAKKSKGKKAATSDAMNSPIPEDKACEESALTESLHASDAEKKTSQDVHSAVDEPADSSRLASNSQQQTTEPGISDETVSVLLDSKQRENPSTGIVLLDADVPEQTQDNSQADISTTESSSPSQEPPPETLKTADAEQSQIRDDEPKADPLTKEPETTVKGKKKKKKGKKGAAAEPEEVPFIQSADLPAQESLQDQLAPQPASLPTLDYGDGSKDAGIQQALAVDTEAPPDSSNIVESGVIPLAAAASVASALMHDDPKSAGVSQSTEEHNKTRDLGPLQGGISGEPGLTDTIAEPDTAGQQTVGPSGESGDFAHGYDAQSKSVDDTPPESNIDTATSPAQDPLEAPAPTPVSAEAVDVHLHDDATPAADELGAQSRHDAEDGPGLVDAAAEEGLSVPPSQSVETSNPPTTQPEESMDWEQETRSGKKKGKKANKKKQATREPSPTREEAAADPVIASAAEDSDNNKSHAIEPKSEPSTDPPSTELVSAATGEAAAPESQTAEEISMPEPSTGKSKKDKKKKKLANWDVPAEDAPKEDPDDGISATLPPVDTHDVQQTTPLELSADPQEEEPSPLASTAKESKKDKKKKKGLPLDDQAPPTEPPALTEDAQTTAENIEPATASQEIEAAHKEDDLSSVPISSSTTKKGKGKKKKGSTQIDLTESHDAGIPESASQQDKQETVSQDVAVIATEPSQEELPPAQKIADAVDDQGTTAEELKKDEKPDTSQTLPTDVMLADKTDEPSPVNDQEVSRSPAQHDVLASEEPQTSVEAEVPSVDTSNQPASDQDQGSKTPEKDTTATDYNSSPSNVTPGEPEKSEPDRDQERQLSTSPPEQSEPIIEPQDEWAAPVKKSKKGKKGKKQTLEASTEIDTPASVGLAQDPAPSVPQPEAVASDANGNTDVEGPSTKKSKKSKKKGNLVSDEPPEDKKPDELVADASTQPLDDDKPPVTAESSADMLPVPTPAVLEDTEFSKALGEPSANIEIPLDEPNDKSLIEGDKNALEPDSVEIKPDNSKDLPAQGEIQVPENTADAVMAEDQLPATTKKSKKDNKKRKGKESDEPALSVASDEQAILPVEKDGSGDLETPKPEDPVDQTPPSDSTPVDTTALVEPLKEEPADISLKKSKKDKKKKRSAVAESDKDVAISQAEPPELLPAIESEPSATETSLTKDADVPTATPTDTVPANSPFASDQVTQPPSALSDAKGDIDMAAAQEVSDRPAEDPLAGENPEAVPVLPKDGDSEKTTAKDLDLKSSEDAPADEWLEKAVSKKSKKNKKQKKQAEALELDAEPLSQTQSSEPQPVLPPDHEITEQNAADSSIPEPEIAESATASTAQEATTYDLVLVKKGKKGKKNKAVAWEESIVQEPSSEKAGTSDTSDKQDTSISTGVEQEPIDLTATTSEAQANTVEDPIATNETALPDKDESVSGVSPNEPHTAEPITEPLVGESTGSPTPNSQDVTPLESKPSEEPELVVGKKSKKDKKKKKQAATEQKEQVELDAVASDSIAEPSPAQQAEVTQEVSQEVVAVPLETAAENSEVQPEKKSKKDRKKKDSVTFADELPEDKHVMIPLSDADQSTSLVTKTDDDAEAKPEPAAAIDEWGPAKKSKKDKRKSKRDGLAESTSLDLPESNDQANAVGGPVDSNNNDASPQEVADSTLALGSLQQQESPAEQQESTAEPAMRDDSVEKTVEAQPAVASDVVESSSTKEGLTGTLGAAAIGAVLGSGATTLMSSDSRAEDSSTSKKKSKKDKKRKDAKLADLEAEPELVATPAEDTVTARGLSSEKPDEPPLEVAADSQPTDSSPTDDVGETPSTAPPTAVDEKPTDSEAMVEAPQAAQTAVAEEKEFPEVTTKKSKKDKKKKNAKAAIPETIQEPSPAAETESGINLLSDDVGFSVGQTSDEKANPDKEAEVNDWDISAKKGKKDKKKSKVDHVNVDDIPDTVKPDLATQDNSTTTPKDSSEPMGNEEVNEKAQLDVETDDWGVLSKKSKKDKKKKGGKLPEPESEPSLVADVAPAEPDLAPVIVEDKPVAAPAPELGSDPDQQKDINVDEADTWGVTAKKSKKDKKKKKGNAALDLEAPVISETPVNTILEDAQLPSVTGGNDLVASEAVPIESQMEAQPAELSDLKPTLEKSTEEQKKSSSEPEGDAATVPDVTSPTTAINAGLIDLASVPEATEQAPAEPPVTDPNADTQTQELDEWALPAKKSKKDKKKKGQNKPAVEVLTGGTASAAGPAEESVGSTPPLKSLETSAMQSERNSDEATTEADKPIEAPLSGEDGGGSLPETKELTGPMVQSPLKEAAQEQTASAESVPEPIVSKEQDTKDVEPVAADEFPEVVSKKSKTSKKKKGANVQDSDSASGTLTPTQDTNLIAQPEVSDSKIPIDDPSTLVENTEEQVPEVAPSKPTATKSSKKSKKSKKAAFNSWADIEEPSQEVAEASAAKATVEEASKSMEMVPASHADKSNNDYFNRISSDGVDQSLLESSGDINVHPAVSSALRPKSIEVEQPMPTSTPPGLYLMTREGSDVFLKDGHVPRLLTQSTDSPLTSPQALDSTEDKRARSISSMGIEGADSKSQDESAPSETKPKSQALVDENSGTSSPNPDVKRSPPPKSVTKDDVVKASVAGAVVVGGVASLASKVGASTKKSKKKKKTIDKRTQQDDDLFDDPSLWEGSDRKLVEGSRGDLDSGDFWEVPESKTEHVGAAEGAGMGLGISDDAIWGIDDGGNRETGHLDRTKDAVTDADDVWGTDAGAQEETRRRKYSPGTDALNIGTGSDPRTSEHSIVSTDENGRRGGIALRTELVDNAGVEESPILGRETKFEQRQETEDSSADATPKATPVTLARQVSSPDASTAVKSQQAGNEDGEFGSSLQARSLEALDTSMPSPRSPLGWDSGKDATGSPYIYQGSDTGVSPSRTLPPVQEEEDEGEVLTAGRRTSLDKVIARDLNRDSGYSATEPLPLPEASRRRPRLDRPESSPQRDSGVHLRDWPESEGPRLSPSPTRREGRDRGDDTNKTPNKELGGDKNTRLESSPLLAEGHTSRALFNPSTPKLGEPETQAQTPDPSKKKNKSVSGSSKKRGTYQELGSAAIPPAILPASVALAATSSTAEPSGHRRGGMSENLASSNRYSPAAERSLSGGYNHDQGAPRHVSNMSATRLRATPEPLNFRPDSPGGSSIRSFTGTPPLRRADRRVSGDLRSLSQRSSVIGQTQDKQKDKDRSGAAAAAAVVGGVAVAAAIASRNNLDDAQSSSHNTTPVANEGRVRAKDMTDVYDGYGEGRIGSPRSPTRPHSMRRRQSMQVLELESRVDQLLAENRMLNEARTRAEQSLSQKTTSLIADRDEQIDALKRSVEFLNQELARLTEVNEGLHSAISQTAVQHDDRYRQLQTQHDTAKRELEKSRSVSGASAGASHALLADKDAEISRLRAELESTKERVRELQRQILADRPPDGDFLTVRDIDYFDHRCQALCAHVQQWVLRFSKFSDMRACRLTNEINDEKIIDRLDNALLDGSDVDHYLRDRVKRRDIFMSMTMSMIWEFVFTRYLFGMDREQRQKLKSLEKLLLEVGPPQAVRQWRAITLTLLSRRASFRNQKEQDTEAVVQAVLQTLSMILPPPSNLEDQIQSQLRRVVREAVDLSVEMRTQRAEYVMLPPLQPEYDANGDLAATVTFNAAMMNERSSSNNPPNYNEELQAEGATVRVVLFPLVVKKGDDTGVGDDEIVVHPAQVLVPKSSSSGRRGRMTTPSSDAGGVSLLMSRGGDTASRSNISMPDADHNQSAV